jgi:hypothetical protein
MTRTIVTLTAIPPRFADFGATFRCIQAQREKIDEIILYLPKHYKRFNMDLDTLPEVPEGVTIRVVDEDLGPATKILPASRELRGQDVRIIFGDDDQLYDPAWAGRLVAASKERPDCAIAEEAWQVDDLNNQGYAGTNLPRAQLVRKTLKYRMRRALSLGRWQPRRYVTAGYVDIFEAWSGTLVRPEFFTDAAFEIPDFAWLVDDVWLSGQLALNGIGIWLNLVEYSRMKSNDPLHWGEAALHRQYFNGMGRDALNHVTIDHFRAVHGIWGGMPPGQTGESRPRQSGQAAE